MLGLGLGLNKSNLILTSGVDPRIQAAIDANATMLLMGDLANGTSPGNNTDPTSTWADLINSNDATLTNFAWTTSSGWDGVTVPSGTEQMLKADGVDDYGVIANNANLDPTGTEDFAICGVIKTGATIDTGYLFAKNDIGSSPSDFQYGVVSVGGNLTLYYGVSLSINALSSDTIHSFSIKRIGGNMKMTFDGAEVRNQADSQSLVSKPNTKIFARTTTGGGPAALLNFHLGVFAFFYNGATGLNETDVDNACALLKAPYF